MTAKSKTTAKLQAQPQLQPQSNPQQLPRHRKWRTYDEGMQILHFPVTSRTGVRSRRMKPVLGTFLWYCKKGLGVNTVVERSGVRHYLKPEHILGEIY